MTQTGYTPTKSCTLLADAADMFAMVDQLQQQLPSHGEPKQKKCFEQDFQETAGYCPIGTLSIGMLLTSHSDGDIDGFI